MPAAEGVAALQVLLDGKEALAKLGEAAQKLCDATLDLIVGESVGKELEIGRGRCIAEQEAAEAKAPGIEIAGRLANLLSVVGIAGPADVTLGDPLAQGGDFGSVDLEALADNVAGQEIEDCRAR